MSNLPTPKTCLVTGGASGLGKAIARKYLLAGANVVICDINTARLQEATTELSDLTIETETGTRTGRLKAIHADITFSESVQNLISSTIREFQSLDVLVNNAGIMDKFDPVGDVDEELWEKVMAVNLHAPFLLSKLVIRHMLSRENEEGKRVEGCIINIVSVAGKAGWAAGAAYTASKHGLVGLTKNTASFYGPEGIRCNALVVGGMDTNITDALKTGVNVEGYQKTKELVGALKLPLCDVERVAEVCVSVTFDRGMSLVNGACIPVDHGWGGVYGTS